MEEQKVSFETAKLAKEKGFDINVNYFISQYNKDGGIVFSESVESDNYNSSNWNSDTRVSIFSRPTQSLLQKWLREVNRLFVEPQMYIEEGVYKFKYLVKSDFEYDLIVLKEKGDFPTWEKALEEGLQEGLKELPNK